MQKIGIDFSHYQLRDASASELIKNFKDADILLTNMADFTAEVIDGLENVKVILRHSIGYDKVDVEAETKNGIIFANEATASSDDVAEHAIMLILETYRTKKAQVTSRIYRLFMLISVNWLTEKRRDGKTNTKKTSPVIWELPLRI